MVPPPSTASKPKPELAALPRGVEGGGGAGCPAQEAADEHVEVALAAQDGRAGATHLARQRGLPAGSSLWQHTKRIVCVAQFGHEPCPICEAGEKPAFATILTAIVVAECDCPSPEGLDGAGWPHWTLPTFLVAEVTRGATRKALWQERGPFLSIGEGWTDAARRGELAGIRVRSTAAGGHAA